MMTKEECAQTLIGLVLHEIDPEDHAAQHACLRGAKALLKDGIHNRRNHASRVARGLPPFCQPLAKTPETCQPLAKPAAPVCQGPAKNPETCQPLAKTARDVCQALANPPFGCQPLAKPAAGAEPWVFAAEED